VSVCAARLPALAHVHCGVRRIKCACMRAIKCACMRRTLARARTCALWRAPSCVYTLSFLSVMEYCADFTRGLTSTFFVLIAQVLCELAKSRKVSQSTCAISTQGRQSSTSIVNQGNASGTSIRETPDAKSCFQLRAHVREHVQRSHEREHTCIERYVRVCVCAGVHVHSLYTCAYACACVYIYIHAHLIYIHAHLFYVYVSVHVYTHTLQTNRIFPSVSRAGKTGRHSPGWRVSAPI